MICSCSRCLSWLYQAVDRSSISMTTDKGVIAVAQTVSIWNCHYCCKKELLHSVPYPCFVIKAWFRDIRWILSHSPLLWYDARLPLYLPPFTYLPCISTQFTPLASIRPGLFSPFLVYILGPLLGSNLMEFMQPLSSLFGCTVFGCNFKWRNTTII